MKKHTTMYKNWMKLSLLLLIAGVIFSSCQRVIDVKLNSADSQIVIQAYVTDQPNIDTVLITQTGSYFIPGTYPKVNGATVIITDNQGTTDTLVQVDSGKYASTHLTGISGHTYTMKAIVSGKEYDAVSTMPFPVSIDSLYPSPTGSGTDTAYRVRCFFADPVSTTNFYMAQAYLNGRLQDSSGNISLDQDKYTNGLEQNLRLRGITAHFNDTVKVNLMSIDADTYSYFSVLRSVAGASNPISTATPQNPPTNIIGGALGYFSAYTLRTKTLIIP